MMPFINEANTRATLQQFGRYEHKDAAEWGETFEASTSLFIDEDMSVSALLNRDGYETRNRLIDEKIQSGEIDPEPYKQKVTIWPGRVDYGRIAQDLNDPNIKPDSVLHQERNEMLRKRREYAQDVQARGPLSATILGTLTAAMLDPLNIATVGIAAPITVGKSLTTLGRVALAARNAALIEGAVELGIQGFVYAHKKDIDSPYSAGDALANIAFAAGGAAVVGGAAAGVSGWLRRVIGYSKELPPSKDVDASLAYLERMAATLESARAQRFDTYDIALNDYQKLLDGEYSDFIEASNKTIATLETELDTITKQAPTLDKFIAENGGLNRALISAEGADIADMKAIKGGFGKPVFRANGGMTVEDLEELLNEANFRGGFVTRNEVLEIVDAVARGETVFMNPEDAAKVDFLGNQIDEFRFNQDNDYLRKLYGEIRERDVQADIEFMREMDKRAQEYAAPQKTADMYADQPATRKPAPQTISARERDYLERNGLTEAYDADLEAYRALENPLIEIDGEQISAADIMKEFDDELTGLESVLTCVIGEAA